MEKFACTLETLFQEKLVLYKEVKTILEQEKNYLAEIDVDSLWKTADRKNRLVLEIEQIRCRIFFFLEENNIFLNMDLKSFNPAQIIHGLPFSEKEKSDLKKITIQLDMIKQDLAGLASGNKRYVNDSLSVISGIFSTITGSDNRMQYAKTGMALTGMAEKHLIKARV